MNLTSPIGTAAFVGRGENLLLMGAPGTGKTVITSQVLERATALGLTSEYLHGGHSRFAEEQLLGRGPGFSCSSDHEHGLSSTLLNCDLLLIGEFESWLEAAPAAFMVLLSRRIELGKANVLVASSCSWKRLYSKEAAMLRRSPWQFDNPAFLFSNKTVPRCEWGKMLLRDPCMPLPQLLASIAIDFIVPQAKCEQTTRQPDSQPISGRLQTSFPNKPVWHLIYTGEKTYREIICRRF